jgi:hypothetical protein
MSALVCGLVARGAEAGDLVLGLGYIGEYDSNIRRVPTDATSEWTDSLVGGFSYIDATPELSAHVVARFERRNYREDSFPDETRYDVDAAAVWNILPRRFSWIVQDRYAPVVLDVAAPDIPTNRVGANIFNTGPDLFARLNPVDTLALSARYGIATFDEPSGPEHDRYAAAGRWLHAADSTTTFSLNLEGVGVKFADDVANDNFRRGDAFVSADIHPSRSRFTVDLGATRIDRERGSDLDGPLARLTWTRQITVESSAGLTLGAEYSDVGTALLGTLTDPTVPAAPVAPPLTRELLTGEPYYLKHVDAYYAQLGTRFGVRLFASARDLDYDVSTQDVNERSGRVEFAHNPAGTFVTTLFGGVTRAQYPALDRTDQDLAVGLGMTYRMSRTMSAELAATWENRSSTDPAAEYDDRRVFISLIYTSGPGFTPAKLQ